MIGAVAKAIFGSSNDRYVRSLSKIVDVVNGFEPRISAMTDDELRQQTPTFRQRLAAGEELDDILPEAFATVREAARRTLGQRRYDVQLIGEARTPLIISGPTDDKSELYMSVDALVKQLVPEDYEVDEKQRSVVLTEDGTERVERMLEGAGLLEGANLYDFENTQVVHHLNQALRANIMFKRDTDYIVKQDKVIIIDEFTGRMMEGRRWSDGLHQAVEAKEGVQIEPENQTLASITFQNYFRMYPKLSGMTGTAATEASEFWDIYKMNVVSIPTNVPVRRNDEEDEFYKNMGDKFAAIVEAIRDKQKLGQPI